MQIQNFSKTWLKEFVLEQKCMPWRLRNKFCMFRNMIFNINTKQYWDSVWFKEKDYLDSQRFYRAAFSKIISLVPQGSKVVDVGCGIGILIDKLRNEKACNVLGVDISEEGINIVKSKGMDGVTTKVPPIPLLDNSFDVSIATELLEHVQNPRSVLREMARIIKPSGLLIVSVPDNSLTPSAEREHLRAFSQKQLRDLLTQIYEIRGIDIFRVKETNSRYYRFIAKGQKCQK